MTLTNGVAYGENYQTIAVDATVQGRQVDASRVLVAGHGMQVTGSGGYNLASKHLSARIQGSNIQLSKLDVFRNANLDADAVLTLNADADGTIEEPNLHATLGLTNVVADGKPLGELTATAHSTGSNVFYDAHSTLVGAHVDVTGQTSLKGNYDTQAKLTLAGLDIAKPIALFSPNNMVGSSSIGGTVTVSGPAATPQALTGTADFNDFDVKLAGVELKSAGPIRASLHGGVVAFDQLHITGQDTDLNVGGTARVFGDPNPAGGRLDLNASGSVSMALAHTFDHDIISSGKVTFNVAVNGRLKQPQFGGDLQFVHVNVAVDGIPNGLTDLNGSLTFNQNRLDVKDLVGTTGGGKLRIGGSLNYQQKGIFADLTATGDVVRVLSAEGVHEVRAFRPGTDQAHVPAQDVQQLRQFVDRAAAQELADRAEPVVEGDVPVRRRLRLVHRLQRVRPGDQMRVRNARSLRKHHGDGFLGVRRVLRLRIRVSSQPRPALPGDDIVRVRALIACGPVLVPDFSRCDADAAHAQPGLRKVLAP